MNIKNVAICVNCPLQPMFHATDCDHNFFHALLIIRSRAISTNAICEMATKVVYPQPDCLTAYNYASFAKQILNVSCAQREAMVSPNRVSNDLTRIVEAL